VLGAGWFAGCLFGYAGKENKMDVILNSLSWWKMHLGNVLEYGFFCGLPLLMVALLIIARVQNWLWKSNPLTIGGYRSEGVTFASTRRQNFILFVWCIVLLVLLIWAITLVK